MLATEVEKMLINLFSEQLDNKVGLHDNQEIHKMASYVKYVATCRVVAVKTVLP